MKIVITGGCGFLGSNLASSYIEKGDEVVVIDALFRRGADSNLQWLNQIKGGKLTFELADLADEKKVNDVLQRHAPYDYLAHLAGQVAMTTSLNDPRRDFLTNAYGTFNVLEATRRYSPEAFIAYSSTNKVYGDLLRLTYEEGQLRYTVPEFPNGFSEDLPLDLSTPYGCSKGAADQYVRDWSRVYGVKSVVFRHSSIYGDRQFSTFDQGWIGWFCRKAYQQKLAIESGSDLVPFTIAGTGKQVRDVLHSDDLISLYHTAYTRNEYAAGQIFNIGGGIQNSLSLLELFRLLEELLELGRSLSYTSTPRRQSDQDFFVADITKARTLLNWTPRVTSREGILRMLSWSQAHLVEP